MLLKGAWLQIPAEPEGRVNVNIPGRFVLKAPSSRAFATEMGKTAKVVVCGARGVGKTAILEQLIHGHVTPETVKAAFEGVKNEVDSAITPVRQKLNNFFYFCL